MFISTYGRGDEEEEEKEKKEESGDCLASCMHMTWFFCGESEEDLRAMVGRFVEVSRRRGLKVNAGKSKVMVLGGEERLEYEVCVEDVSEFIYLGCVLDASGK